MTRMLRIIALGCWLSICAFGTGYLVVAWDRGRDLRQEGPGPSAAATLIKLRTISVPVIRDGAVQGYVLAQLLVQADAAAAKSYGQKPEALLADQAFRTLYASEDLDFRRLRRQDLPALSQAIVEGANRRAGLPLVRDVLIQELSYVTRDEARGGAHPALTIRGDKAS